MRSYTRSSSSSSSSSGEKRERASGIVAKPSREIKGKQYQQCLLIRLIPREGYRDRRETVWGRENELAVRLGVRSPCLPSYVDLRGGDRSNVQVPTHRHVRQICSIPYIANNSGDDDDALISRFKSSSGECISERGALDVTRVYVYTPTKHIKEKGIRIHTSTRYIRSLDHMNVTFVTKHLAPLLPGRFKLARVAAHWNKVTIGGFIIMYKKTPKQVCLFNDYYVHDFSERCCTFRYTTSASNIIEESLYANYIYVSWKTNDTIMQRVLQLDRPLSSCPPPPAPLTPPSFLFSESSELLSLFET
ncbi:unnamed protein product, partial [Trichogramma brassicae]